MMWNEAMYWWGQGAAWLGSQMAYRMDVRWQADLPAGPKIFAPNHPNTLDPVIVTGLVPERMHILIDNTLFKLPVVGAYLRRTGHIPVVPGEGRTAFDTAVDLLRAGENIGIFPEGRISPLTGGCYPGRTGAARLALLTGAPIVPVGIAIDRRRIRLTTTIVGGEPAVGTWYTSGPYSVTFGEAFAVTGDIEDRAFVRSEAQRVMAHVNACATLSEGRLPEQAQRRPLLRNHPVRLNRPARTGESI